MWSSWDLLTRESRRMTRGPLVLVGESVDLAVEGVKLGVLDAELVRGPGTSDELVERDAEDVGDVDENV
jgi:hypothetical protein